MDNIRVFIYQLIPKAIRQQLGKSTVFSPLRNIFFRTVDGYREAQVAISKVYGAHSVEFQFIASVQIASKAQKRGIESKLLRNSIQLLHKNKPRELDDYIIADVGTNFGFLSLVWSQTVCRSGKVYSFEPHPHLYQTFCRSVDINHLEPVIAPNNVAVGRTPGSVEISLASTSSNTIQENVASKTVREFKTIEMITLDDYFNDYNRLDLIKIDVDGIELEILEGSKNILKKLKPIVIVETNGDHAICEFFTRLEYLILDMDMKPFDINHVLPLNLFCIPK